LDIGQTCEGKSGTIDDLELARPTSSGWHHLSPGHGLFASSIFNLIEDDMLLRRLFRERNELLQIRIPFRILIAITVMITPLFGQAKRLWVLQGTGEMAEYDPASFALKQKVKAPPDAVKSPTAVEVNQAGQILFAAPISLPLSDEDAVGVHKVWLWNGQSASTIDQGVQRKTEATGSNQAVTDLVPVPHLSADGKSLYWFGNESRRLEREGVDLSITTTWKAWRTDIKGEAREEVASTTLPDCRCPTGSCEESCPSGMVWVPDTGVDKFFLVTQIVAGQTATLYKSTTAYTFDGGKWSATPLAEALQRVLDVDSKGTVIINSLPDTGCCGWSNQSNDQTMVLASGKKISIFDERETYKNPDYDVSFLTSNAKLSPDSARVAMTITATAQPGKPIQLSDDGEANPEESQSIRKAMTALPAVAVKTVEDGAKQVAFMPHATLVDWINDKELLIVEDHMLVVYNLASGARRKTSVHVEDAAHVFLR
jgi:hypothetical protein